MIVRQTNLSRSAERDVAWIIETAKRDTDAIGFIPAPTVWRLHHQGRAVIAHHGSELFGWALRGAPRPQTKIYQIWIRDDLRRLTHATAICDFIARQVWHKGATSLTLRCGDDLPANWFWRAVGFAQTDQTRGGRRRGRLINHYQAQIDQKGLITPPAQEIGRTTSLLTSAERPRRPQTPLFADASSFAAASSHRFTTTGFTRAP